MKIAVVAANGRVARKVITEALGRGIDVTAFVRGENNTDAKKFVVKDIFDLTSDDLKGFDVVVDAFGAWKPELRPDVMLNIHDDFRHGRSPVKHFRDRPVRRARHSGR